MCTTPKRFAHDGDFVWEKPYDLQHWETAQNRATMKTGVSLQFWKSQAHPVWKKTYVL